VPRITSVCESGSRTDIEERISALIDSQHHGLDASKLCRTAADRQLTKQLMDDLTKQIGSLRAQLKSLEIGGKSSRRL
jgi:hypothetical protein